ncbi:DUF3019 domain-containing protein [Shewanella sp. 202IG2-18]|nr:DUF3019 domain-containing protein [Parashewanella hymeniacidonis]
MAKALPPNFSVSPKACVIPSYSSSCEIVLSFSWKTKAGNRFCLYQQNVDTPLHCATLGNKTNLKIPFYLKSTTTFFLRNSTQQVAEQTIKIIKMDTKELRRRRKSAWSLL